MAQSSSTTIAETIKHCLNTNSFIKICFNTKRNKLISIKREIINIRFRIKELILLHKFCCCVFTQSVTFVTKYIWRKWFFFKESLLLTISLTLQYISEFRLAHLQYFSQFGGSTFSRSRYHYACALLSL